MRAPRAVERPRLAIYVALAVVGALLLVACGGGRSGPLVVETGSATEFDYDFLIPLGTGERIASGEPVEILPAELEVRVGEVIRIENQDTKGHFVGIFYVGAGETVTQRFASEGQYVGSCSVHPSGELTLTVRG